MESSSYHSHDRRNRLQTLSKGTTSVYLMYLGGTMAQLARITIFAGDFENETSADYKWVVAWLERWKAELRIANYSTGGWEHTWDIEAPEAAIAEVPDDLLCASEWSGWNVPRR